MYGHIHCVVKDLVTSKFGQETWETILPGLLTTSHVDGFSLRWFVTSAAVITNGYCTPIRKEAGVNERDHFMLFYHYDDSIILTLVGAASKCLDLPAATVLEVFGDFFLMHCLRYGYDDMLRTLGSDITSFIQNLDSLHSLLALTYDKMVAPSFRCEVNEDESLTLHYYSARTGLHPLVKGVLKAVAREIFDQEVEITLLSENTENIAEAEGGQYHATFRVVIVTKEDVRPRPEGLEVVKKKREDSLIEDQLSPVSLTRHQFVTAFPYHLIFDENLRLLQCGCNVAKLSPVSLDGGIDMTSMFRILYPRMAFTVANIKRFINAIFVIAIDSLNCENEDVFSMKGQMIWMADSKLMIFIGSPRLTSLKEMKRMNMYMADIPLYDVTREMVLLYQQRNAEIDITKKLDETTAELKRTSRELELEKQKTETLLYQMLPQKVANQLKNGQKVEAEKFDQVTILFSDIVTFTNIAAACSPLDIVNMLNDMYHRFDLKTTEHGVYKVETIGDAYMVVSGVPEKTDLHAQPVANFALDMAEQASYVLSPATGRPLQIRVGIHTGPVVAGVVGLKMPRYCLFGDTVNTASRMESHGIPGRIHLSPTTYRALQGHGYQCKARGETNIKGKGLMRTYFLTGNDNHVITEPDDEYVSLPVLDDGADSSTEINSPPGRQGSDKNKDVSGATAMKNIATTNADSLTNTTQDVTESQGTPERNGTIDINGDSDVVSKASCANYETENTLTLRDVPVSNASLAGSENEASLVGEARNGANGHGQESHKQIPCDTVSYTSETGHCPSASKTCLIL